MKGVKCMSLNYINKYVEQQLIKHDTVNNILNFKQYPPHQNNNNNNHDNEESTTNNDISNNVTENSYDVTNDVDDDEEEEEEVSKEDNDVTSIHATSTTPSLAEPLEGGAVSNADSLLMCLVCGDRGSGYHYTAFTCEGLMEGGEEGGGREERGGREEGGGREGRGMELCTEWACYRRKLSICNPRFLLYCHFSQF